MNNSNTPETATPTPTRGRKPSQHVKLTIGEIVNKYWDIRALAKDFPVVSGSTRPMNASEVKAHVTKLAKADPNAELDLGELVVRTGGATFGELVEGVDKVEDFNHPQKDQEIDLNVSALRKLTLDKATRLFT